MTNNTINNVTRELLADLLGNDHDKRIMAERHLLAMLANAPSPAGVDGWDVAGDILEKLSAAQAIIDGLRGEVAELQSMITSLSRAGIRMRTERDQQAQRIGELEGLLRESGKTIHKLQAEQPTPARIARYLDAMRGQIDAALSAGKDGE